MADKFLTLDGEILTNNGDPIKVDDSGVIKTPEEKTVTPSTTEQVVTPTTNDNELTKVTVEAIQTEEKTVTPTTEQTEVTPTTGKLLNKVTVEGVTSDIDENITPNNIKKNVTVLGVTGTLSEGLSYGLDYDESNGTLEITNDIKLSEFENDGDGTSPFITENRLALHRSDTNNPHNVTKAQVGLNNVDNTSDLYKPLSVAMQAALNGKSAKSHDHNDLYYTEGECDSLFATKETEDLVKEKQFGLTFDSYDDLVNNLNSMTEQSEITYRPGQSIYIITLGVPDLWIKSMSEEYVEYSYTDDDAIINELDFNGTVHIGCFLIAKLETFKQDLTDYVKKTDYAKVNKAGVVQIAYGGQNGVTITEKGELLTAPATSTEIAAKASNYKPIVPSSFQTALNNHIAGNANAGAIKVQKFYGLNVFGNGDSYVVRASDEEITAKIDLYKPIVPATLDTAVKEGLANNALDWTDDEKTNARTIIGALDETTANTLYASKETEDLVKEKSYSKGFDNYQSLVTELNSVAKDKYNVGQSFLIVTLNVPDLWVKSIEETSVPYTYTTDEAIITALNTNGTIQFGHYVLSMLETLKQDLTNYVKNTDFGGNNKAGIVKAYNAGGSSISSNGSIMLVKATDAEIADKASNYKPIVPSNFQTALNNHKCSNETFGAVKTSDGLISSDGVVSVDANYINSLIDAKLPPNGNEVTF